jgi:Domain of unknown function (DUF6089)
MRTTWFAILFLFSMCLCAQDSKKFERSKEIDIIGGTSYYMGDLNPTKHFGTRLKPGGGIAFRNNFDRRWSMKCSLLYGRVEAYDADSDDPWQRNRNLHFRNQMIEGSITAELNFFNYQLGDRDYPFSPYLFAGLAYLNMKPMANFKGTWYELQPLGTEGQGSSLGGDKYKTNLISIPFGFGVKGNLFAVFGFSLEWGVRKTWTDYFDDVSGSYADPLVLQKENGTLSSALSDRSLIRERATNDTDLQRGDPGRKDFYFFCLGSINIRIDKRATTCWK